MAPRMETGDNLLPDVAAFRVGNGIFHAGFRQQNGWGQFASPDWNARFNSQNFPIVCTEGNGN